MTPADATLIAEQIRNLHDKLDTTASILTDGQKRIEKQTTDTNGRVTAIERWKDRMTGAWIVLSFAGPVVTGLIIVYASPHV